ncbi:hypothetical protein BN168_670101 [Clostridioides difficile CD002]|nr:hypothetical protein BN167_2030063 [Clostridioides difficile E13]CCL08836.1 hypothetical protein BN168_670101 [Clostridioides difficile CD002]CCL12870.1 hypothetical protein BN169_900100 [Clostridioides difficile E16]CCL43777.1 hypothetical protein BN177_570099 [Clostridioides difficile E24]CCL47816.1 hypothetical protein BN178_830100 [Clostridioides difficile T42]CCL50941.1 hypothetical protein BN179_2940060 [Clostridioides difficile T6]CCL54887.1 hypothetical protein BN180_2480060 [Clost
MIQPQSLYKRNSSFTDMLIVQNYFFTVILYNPEPSHKH